MIRYLFIQIYNYVLRNDVKNQRFLNSNRRTQFLEPIAAVFSSTNLISFFFLRLQLTLKVDIPLIAKPGIENYINAPFHFVPLFLLMAISINSKFRKHISPLPPRLSFNTIQICTIDVGL